MIREPIQPTAVYKPQEAARVVGVDKSVIYNAINIGKIPKRELGRGLKILGSDLITFVSGTVTPVNQQTPTQSSIGVGGSEIYKGIKNE